MTPDPGVVLQRARDLCSLATSIQRRSAIIVATARRLQGLPESDPGRDMPAVATALKTGASCSRCLARLTGRSRTRVDAALNRLAVDVALFTTIERCDGCAVEAAVVHRLN